MRESRAPYGHHREEPVYAAADGVTRQAEYSGTTYYERPALKSSSWGWLIVTYFWIGGIAGAAQLIAAIIDLTQPGRHRKLIRAGRYVALSGALASPVLLIMDLHTPQRWYNMLRIFRRTSAMSIGSWTLSIFGALTGAIAVAQAADDLLDLPIASSAARIASIPAAGAASMMSFYTGMLLSVTSTPLWSTADEVLPIWFGASAIATGTAMLTLTMAALDTDSGTENGLDHIAQVSSGAELAAAVLAEVRWRKAGVAGPLDEPRVAVAYRFGALGLGILLPFGIHIASVVTGRRSRSLSVLAAVSTLVGGFCLRAVMVFAGNESAHRPRDYFSITQPLSDSER